MAGPSGSLSAFRAARAKRDSSVTKVSKEQIAAIKAQRAAASSADAASTAPVAAQVSQAPQTPASVSMTNPQAPSPNAALPGSPKTAPRNHISAATIPASSEKQGRETLAMPPPPSRPPAAERPQAPAKPSTSTPHIPGLPPGFMDPAAASLAEPEPAAEQHANGGEADEGRVSGSLPAGFFEASEAAEEPEEAAVQPAFDTARPDAAGAEPQEGPLPTGFFENKDADAKARGAPPPKQVQAEDYDEFMASLASDVRDLEAREEAAAEDAAQERAEREGFEQRQRLQRLQELQESRKRGLQEHPNGAAAKVARLDPASEDGQEGSDDSQEEEEGDEDAFGWRAKRF